MARDYGRHPERVVHDEQTLFKVYFALKVAGITGQLAQNAVTQMQNQGILFREHDIGRELDPVDDLADAIRLTVEYVGNDMLPPIAGWAWFDALKRQRPDLVKPFLDKPIHRQGGLPGCLCLINSCVYLKDHEGAHTWEK